MKWNLTLIALLGLIHMACVPVHAVNVSFSSIDGAADRDIYLYSSSGVLLGLYNTSSTGIELTNDAIFMFKPQTTSFLESPDTWLTGVAFPWIKTNIIGLIVFVVLIWIAFGRR